MKELLKKIAFRHTAMGTPKYEYNVEPEQLAEIISSIVHLGGKKNNLNLFEIGVARGMTTRFIAEHVMTNKLNAKFYCLDTFSSFTTDDLNFETVNDYQCRKILLDYLKIQRVKKTMAEGK